jgi:S1-C subfamily serine protease
LSRSNVKVVSRRSLTVACAAVLAPFAIADAAERPAVVTVRVWSAAGVAERATGTVVRPGEVLTVDHVLASGDRVEVLGGDGVRRGATVIRRRPALDLALLRAPGATGPTVRFGEAGDDLRVLTARDGLVRARSAGLRRRIVARLVDQPGRPRRPSLDLAVAVAAGDSGAPVVDDDGDVVGVVYARSTRRDGTAYAVRGEGLRRLAG